MSDRALVLESIEHWKRMCDDPLGCGEEPFTEDCPLCKEYRQGKGSCEGCPVAVMSGISGCNFATYFDARNAFGQLEENNTLENRFKWRHKAQKMIEYLVKILSHLPEEESETKPVKKSERDYTYKNLINTFKKRKEVEVSTLRNGEYFIGKFGKVPYIKCHPFEGLNKSLSYGATINGTIVAQPNGGLVIQISKSEMGELIRLNPHKQDATCPKCGKRFEGMGRKMRNRVFCSVECRDGAILHRALNLALAQEKDPAVCQSILNMKARI